LKKFRIKEPLGPSISKTSRIAGFHEKNCQVFDNFLRNFHGQGKLARDQTPKGSITGHFFGSWYSKRLVAP